MSSKSRKKDRDGLYQRSGRGAWYFKYEDAEGRWLARSTGTSVYNEAKRERAKFLDDLKKNRLPNDRAKWTLKAAVDQHLAVPSGSLVPLALAGEPSSCVFFSGPQSLIYYADFTAVPHVQQTSSGGGGKGLGGGGGSTQTTTTYTYTAATMGALCSGPISGIVNVWDTKGRFQQTSATESFTIPGGGGAYTVVNHGLFKLGG